VRARSLVTACIFALGCRPESQQAAPSESAQRPPVVSISQARAVIVASEWYAAQGGDPNAAKYTPMQKDSGWLVFVDFLPPRIGGHCTLKMDHDLKIIKVVGGR
jgi:hypothetical protein